ncbi:MAG: bifunctional hydroxymethylpyrimidine kinase/phosphomethylpyrimidine kinase [Rhizobiaceae bacterium]
MTEMPVSQKPAIISISSQVARGSVGNRASAFAFGTLGFPAWIVPTVILPYHPGHGKATRIEIDTGQLEKLLSDLEDSPWIEEVGAITTGYIANQEQVGVIAEFISNIRAINPDILYLCDPVIGDSKGLYISEPTAHEIRNKLLPKASLATPNIYELAWLTEQDELTTHAEIADGAKQMADNMHPMSASGPFPGTMAVATSTPGLMRGNIGNLLIHGKKTILAEHKRLPGPGSGAGDLFSAILLATLLDENNVEISLQRAASSVFEVMAGAVKRNDSELMPQLAANSLIRPMAMVYMHNMQLSKNPQD